MHSRIVPNSPELETTQIPTGNRMLEHTVIESHKENFGHEEGTAMPDSVDESHQHGVP